MIYLITAISSFLSGLGIGGGAIYIIFALLFKIQNITDARAYNLLLFLSVGIVIFIKNIKNKEIFNKKYFITLIIIEAGSILGMITNTKINGEKIKKYFYYFMAVIGIYEIISSLISIKNEKNKNRL